MKLADAPMAGLVSRPARAGTRLRWWDGSDWTDDYRVRPTEYEVAGRRHRVGDGAGAVAGWRSLPRAQSRAPAAVRRDTEAIISEVRKVARSEVERAADLFAARPAPRRARSNR